MAELNFKQITDKLNSEFTGDVRKLIFWYDANGEFKDDVDSLQLDNAKIYHLEPYNTFATKKLLERDDICTNYLIYAPFPKPELRDNYLADILLYSKEFCADRVSLICVDLGIRDEYKPVLKKHAKFFTNKERTEKFYKLELEKYNTEIIETAMMAVICKCRTAAFDEVVRVVISDDNIENCKFLDEFEKYNLTESFWRLCEEQYGYHDATPTIKRLLYTFFITYAYRDITCEPPKAWKNYVSFKTGTITAFMTNLMNSVIYRDTFDRLSANIATTIKAKDYLATMQVSDIIECDAFACVDSIVIDWIKRNLISQNTMADLSGKKIIDICEQRTKKHFGEQFFQHYRMLYNAFCLINESDYTPAKTLDKIVENYKFHDCLLDTNYRMFYTSLDLIEESDEYAELSELVDNIYTNEYLNELIPMWCDALKDNGEDRITRQTSFYNHFAAPVVSKPSAKVIVIISDAMRYEVGHELWGKFDNDPQCEATLEPVISTLPSYTKLGMAALLPHRSVEMSEDYKITVDGLPCDSTEQREAILRVKKSNSKCYQFDDVMSWKQAELRKAFGGVDVVYIYHNQIDARGDKANTENEVFAACKEAIDEIYTLVKRLSSNTVGSRFIITADHGFLYKRSKLTEGDKIDGLNDKHNYINKRFIVSNGIVNADATVCYPMTKFIDNKDALCVTVPTSDNIFKAPGAGQNYVHGGASPQEMIIPVIDVRTQSAHINTTTAKISLVSMINKVTSLNINLDFIQSVPCSDTVKATTYKLFFVSEENEKISNECSYVADKRDGNPQKRLFSLKFNFKDKKYDKTKRYMLVAYDIGSEIDEPVFTHAVIMDLAFSDDFGF